MFAKDNEEFKVMIIKIYIVGGGGMFCVILPELLLQRDTSPCVKRGHGVLTRIIFPPFV